MSIGRSNALDSRVGSKREGDRLSIGGTAAHRGLTGMPDLVATAVRMAVATDFEFSCLPAQGRLLAVLAAGRPGQRGWRGQGGTGPGRHRLVAAARRERGHRRLRRVGRLAPALPRRDRWPPPILVGTPPTRHDRASSRRGRCDSGGHPSGLICNCVATTVARIGRPVA